MPRGRIRPSLLSITRKRSNRTCSRVGPATDLRERGVLRRDHYFVSRRLCRRVRLRSVHARRTLDLRLAVDLVVLRIAAGRSLRVRRSLTSTPYGRIRYAFPGMWTERATRSENRHHDDGSAQADGMAEVCRRRGPLPALSRWRRQDHRRRCAPRRRLLGPLRPRYQRRRRGGSNRLGLFRPAGGPLLTCPTKQAFNQGQQDEQGQQEQPFERHG